MGVNSFSIYRTEGSITLKGKTRLFRKVGHSASNWGRAKMRTGAKDNIVSAGSTLVTDGVSLTGAGAGIFIIATVGLTGTATGAAAIIASPAVAIGAAVVGLGFLAKGTYSNRESAHTKLTPYVYSIIDDQLPAIDIYSNSDALKNAAVAAAYLMKDAPSQYKLMSSKLNTRQAAFDKFWKVYEKEIAIFTNTAWKGIQGKMDQYDRVPPGQRSEHAINELINYHEFLNKAKVKADDMWERQSKQGGVVFEFMRRLVKVGNYLQCAEIVSLATYNEAGFKRDVRTVDPFQSWDIAIQHRKFLQKASDLQSEATLNYGKWETFAKRNGVK